MIEGALTLGTERVRFRIERRGRGLAMILEDPEGEEPPQTVLFAPTAASAAAVPQPPARAAQEPPPPTPTEGGGPGATAVRVEINGRVLPPPELEALARAYRVQPRAGRYWYDARSGLFGLVGGGAVGFMRPGHALGKLARGASRGDTGVRVNGRELPRAEWAIWSQLLGAPIAPGAYWLDANGNAGIEGNPQPTVNLYVAAERSRYRGGGGGDNFWSSRFGAGNSSADGSQGYISFPGGGGVTWGM